MRLDVSNLTVHRAGRLILDGLSFAVPDGAALAIVGPNGAGKTTLLEALAGLLPSRAGEIRLEGRSLQGRPAHARAAAGLRLVGEGRRVVPALTVAENLDLAALGARAAMPPELEELFPALGRRRHTAAGQLSGGEQQMLALAMGLAGRPGVLLLDEPSFGLAPQVVDSLFETLGRLREEAGVTLLLAEQHVQRALALCGQVLVLRSGRIVFDSAQPGAGEAEADGARRLESLVDSYLGRQEDAVAVPGRAQVSDLVRVTLPVAVKRSLQLEARRQGRDPGELVAEAVARMLRSAP